MAAMTNYSDPTNMEKKTTLIRAEREQKQETAKKLKRLRAAGLSDGKILQR
ncbi:24486_t:CDS:2 [Gigaspora margarita]|uniref:24486_t:CDS:1 n=1 Tax=Gigaspora margarita TaxID=4874 RepID=A0ABN7WC71_GIGMA|nr:24486_t:CDS:2 [Gigaspora margarita]